GEWSARAADLGLRDPHCPVSQPTLDRCIGYPSLTRITFASLALQGRVSAAPGDGHCARQGLHPRHAVVRQSVCLGKKLGRICVTAAQLSCRLSGCALVCGSLPRPAETTT